MRRGARQVFTEEIPGFSHGNFSTEKWAFQNPGIYLRWLFEKSDALPCSTIVAIGEDDIFTS